MLVKEYQVYFISMIVIIMLAQAQNGISIDNRASLGSLMTDCSFGCEKRIDFYKASDFIRKIK